jgi:hypothetical protein
MRSRSATIEIPVEVLESVDTLDELEDWLAARNARIVEELRAARREDLAGKFKPWRPRSRAWRIKSK